MDFEQKDLININDRFKGSRRAEPKVDKEVSEIVGKPVMTTDPRLIQLVAKWKAGVGSKDVQAVKKADNTYEVITPPSDDFLKDPKKIEELKKVFI